MISIVALLTGIIAHSGVILAQHQENLLQFGRMGVDFIFIFPVS
jgi:hypothetical protein